jgi:hypothetical protein
MALLAVTGFVLFAGCLNPMGETADFSNDGLGKVTLTVSNDAGAGRTVAPDAIKPAFFRVELIPAEGFEGAPVARTFEGNSATIDLFPGQYTLMLSGYDSPDSPPVAKGSKTIGVYAGKTTNAVVALELEPLNDAFTGTGTFAWDFRTTMAEGDIESVDISISKNGEGIKNIDTPIPSQGTESLGTGYYNVITSVETIYGAKSVFYETLWIYPSRDSLWNLNISADNFFAEYGNAAINWTLDPDLPPVFTTEIFEVTRGDRITYTVKETHQTYSFYVDGIQKQNSESTVFVLDTSDLSPGSHEIAVAGMNSRGIPWSTSVRLKVLPAQNFAKSITAGTSSLVINDTVVENNGNIYLAGYQNDAQAVLIKLDPAGNELYRRIPAGTGKSYLNGIVIGPDGRVYASGSFTGTLNFGGEEVSGTSSIENPLIVCFDANGNNIWAKTSLSGTSYGSFGPIAADETGIYTGGMFYYSRTFANGVSVTSNSWANFDSPYLVKFSFDGVPQWAITSSQNRCASISDIVVSNNTLFAVGYTNGSGNSPFRWGNLNVLNGTGYNFNGWAAAFNTADGNAKWNVLAPVGGSSDFNGVSVHDGRVYAAGYAETSVTGMGGDSALKSLVTIYDAATGELVKNTNDGPSGSRNLKVFADASGIYTVGFHNNGGARKSILKKYDADLNLVSTKTVSGDGASEFRNIAAGSGALYIAGIQTNTAARLYDGILEAVYGTAAGNNGVFVKYVK